MRRATLVSVFGLAVGLAASPAFADEAEERKDKTEELAELLVALEDGATPAEREALDEFMEASFEGEEAEGMEELLDEFEDAEFGDDDEPIFSALEDEMELEEEAFFDEEPDEVEDEPVEKEDDLALFDDEMDELELAELEQDELDEPELELAELEEDELDEPEFEEEEAEEEEELGFVVPEGGLTLKGFAAGIGKFEDNVNDERAVATRSTGGADGVTVTITANGQGGHDALVVISAPKTVNPDGTTVPLGDVAIGGVARAADDFEGESATSSGGTSTASSFDVEPNENFSYLVWGSWSHFRGTGTSADRQDGEFSQLIVGQVTPDTADLTGLGTAAYDGKIEGGFAPGSSNVEPADGAFSLTADFAAKTFSGTYDLALDDGSTVVANGTIDSGSWTNPDGLSASLGGTSGYGTVSGALEGAFFGPNAEEVGGNWELNIGAGAGAGEIGGVGSGGFAGKR